MPPTGRCCFCGILMFPAGSPQVRADPYCQQTREHMIPRSIGPSRERMDIKANLRPSCHGCNDMKGDAPWQLYAWFIRQPGVVEMERAARRSSFRGFVYACALAGFTAARRMVLRSRPLTRPSVFTFAVTADMQAENDTEEPAWMKNKIRARHGRFARRPEPNGEHP